MEMILMRIFRGMLSGTNFWRALEALWVAALWVAALAGAVGAQAAEAASGAKHRNDSALVVSERNDAAPKD
jgi:hypothetical protein